MANICKKQFKMDHRPETKSKIYKTLEENMGVNAHDLGFGTGSLDGAQKAQAMRGKKIGKSDLIKIKSVYP